MKLLPIAEIFTSVQGEGYYTGVRMTFVRTAGCSVGRPIPKEEKGALPVYIERCKTYAGHEFLCDTNFQRKEALTVDQILEQIPRNVKHVCLTGGEPLNHNLSELVAACDSHGIKVHVETSGTVEFPAYLCKAWVTVSPKFGVLERSITCADEIKLLVDENFDIKKVPESVMKHRRVYIQPISFEHDLDMTNVQRCLVLQEKYPQFILSLQQHKTLHVR